MQNIDHIAIVVQDLEAALAVYQDALGLSLERVEDVPAEQVRVAFLPFPQGDSSLELVQPTSDDSGIAKFLNKRGEGIHHICLAVDDIELAITQIKAKGLEVLDDKPKVRHNGQKYVFVHPRSAHGVLLELYETQN